MKEQTGESYEGSPYTKDLFVAGAKDGKTTWLVGQCLGVWPGCKNGGVVDSPKNLHILTVDTEALRGVNKFLKAHCDAPDEALKYTVYNMEDDARRVTANAADWNYEFYNGVLDSINRYHERAAKGGTHALIVSSLTGVAASIMRGCFGKPGLEGKDGNAKKGMGGDKAKWPGFAMQISELRNLAHTDPGHCFWEGHLDKKVTGGSGEDAIEQDSINVMGSSGKNFAYNVAHVFRLRRLVGTKYQTKPTVDQVFIDTQPSLTFMNNGRGFSELNSKEWDLTAVLMKLGYKVGRYGAKGSGK